MKIEDIEVGKHYFIRWGGSSAICKKVLGKSDREAVFEWNNGTFSVAVADDFVCEDTRSQEKPAWTPWWS
jgi:hypothetical protein